MRRLILLLLAACVLAGCESPTLTERARATAIAQEAAGRAAARAVEVQATATAAAQAAAEREATAGARAAAVSVMWLAAAVGLLVLCVSCAFAVGAWFTKRATTIYPNAAGQYPVITRRGFGYVAMHDPNRSLGPVTVYRTPTLLDTLAGVIGYLRSGRPPARPAITADFFGDGSETTRARIASQAQAVSALAAVTRPQGLLGGETRRPDDQVKLAQAVMGGGGMLADSNSGYGGAPAEVQLIDDQARIDNLTRLLEDGEE